MFYMTNSFEFKIKKLSQLLQSILKSQACSNYEKNTLQLLQDDRLMRLATTALDTDRQRTNQPNPLN